jgi:hypothetical protein
MEVAATRAVLPYLAPGLVCEPLETQLQVGCPWAPSGPLVVDTPLFAACIADGVPGVHRWIAGVASVDAADAAADAVTQWLRFCHLGCATPDTPATWLLAWAGQPWRPLTAMDSPSPSATVRQWLRAFAGCGQNKSVFWAGMPTMSLDTQKHLTTWLEDMVAEALPVDEWYFDGGREYHFERLRRWLRAPSVVTRRLPAGFADVEPVALGHLVVAQGPHRLPADLRRLLLEVGDLGDTLLDLGYNLLGTKQLGCARLPCIEVLDGPWLWTWSSVVKFDGITPMHLQVKPWL